MSAVWQANWVPTVTPGGPVMQEGVRRSRPASCCPPRPRGVYRVREGPGSLNIPLSCPSPGRECATFFYRGICQGAPPVPLERREPTLPPLPPPSLPPTTTSELQRPCRSFDGESNGQYHGWDTDKSAGQMEMFRVKTTNFADV